MLFLLSVLHLLTSNYTRVDSPKKINLIVDIQNINSPKGVVYIALFKPESKFPEGTPAEGKKVDAKSSTAQATFSVEPGEYAIAVFHDENGNGKLDKRLFGLPKEPYGFSNNFRPRLSAPKFKDCQFTVGTNGKTISIRLE